VESRLLSGRDELLLVRSACGVGVDVAEPASEGRCIRRAGWERVPGLKLGATFLVYHNRDAPKPVPCHGTMHVFGPSTRSREPQLIERLQRKVTFARSSYRAVREGGMRLPSVWVVDELMPPHNSVAHPKHSTAISDGEFVH
jgi:hypothetical protein